MSGHQSGASTPCRVAKTPPNSCKQGPLKATIPMSGVVKQSSSVRSVSGKSPTMGPPISPSFSWRSRTSPEQVSGQRSPGSSSYKGKSKFNGRSTEVIRRTASLDTIYLKGHWPKDTFYWGHMGTLQVDKATQTDEVEHESRKIHCISESEDKLEKFGLRPKIRGNKEPGSRHVSPGDHTSDTSSQTLASCMISPTIKINPVNICVKPLPKASMRSSVEGLNQEIERIVLRTGSEGCSNDIYEPRQATPEGHRAPLAELLKYNRSRSVNTQTPQDFSHSSGESHGSSPDNETCKLGTSPHINKFLAREPPDGCEKVRLKSLDDRTNVLLEHAPPPSTFKLKPSLGSAFKILQPKLSPNEEQIELTNPQDKSSNK